MNKPHVLQLYCKLVSLLHTDHGQTISHFAEQFVGNRIFFLVPLSSVSHMAVLSYVKLC